MYYRLARDGELHFGQLVIFRFLLPPQFPLVGCWHVFLSAPAAGIARGAMDAAAARIEAAETLIRRATESVTADIAATGAVSPQTQVRGRRDHAFGISLCVEAVEDLFRAAGASSLDESSPIQRHWRDVHAVAQHVANNLDSNLGAWGERALGLGDGLRFG